MTEIKFDPSKHTLVETDGISLDMVPFKEGIDKLTNIYLDFIDNHNPYDIGFKVEADSYYGDCYVMIKLSGFRDKTESEIKIEKQRLERIRNNKYLEYLKLKKEFEDE